MQTHVFCECLREKRKISQNHFCLFKWGPGGVLSLETFCPLGHFVPGTLCLGIYVPGTFCPLGRFVCAPFYVLHSLYTLLSLGLSGCEAVIPFLVLLYYVLYSLCKLLSLDLSGCEAALRLPHQQAHYTRQFIQNYVVRFSQIIYLQRNLKDVHLIHFGISY